MSRSNFPLLRLGDSHAGRCRDLTRSHRSLSTETRALSIHPCRKSCIPGERTHAALARPGESIDEGAAAVFVDVDAYDLVERAFGFEAEFARAARLDALWPARDDARDQRVLGAANACGNALAGDAPQRRDLLGDGAADARHRQIDAGTERVARQTRGVHEEADRGARARMGVHHRLWNRQHGFEARERLPGLAGGGGPSRPVWGWPRR